jgi:hypothetical protein
MSKDKCKCGLSFDTIFVAYLGDVKDILVCPNCGRKYLIYIIKKKIYARPLPDYFI